MGMVVWVLLALAMYLLVTLRPVDARVTLR